jgi:hypothetical protein
MKAKFINELHNFERNGEPINKLNIGMGPAKHIKEFESIMDLAKLKWHKSIIDSVINKGTQWNINWIDKEKNERYFHIDLIENKGWTYPGYRGKELLENPFDILNYIMDDIYGDITSKILELKNELAKLNGAIKAKNILKKYNES